MIGNKIVASMCSALFVGASLLEVRADVVLAPHEYDLMMGPAHAPMQCIDGVCIPARVTNGFHPTRWRKWPIVPPARAPRGTREGVSPPPVDIPKADVETQIPGRTGLPGDEPRSAPSERELDRTGPDRGLRDPSSSPSLPVEPREPFMPPEVDEFPSRSEGGRVPQFPRDGRLPRRTPPVASRSPTRQASLIDTLRGEGASGYRNEAEDRELPSVRAEPSPVSSLSDGADPTAATPNPSPWNGTAPPRTLRPVERPPAEQPRAGSAFRAATSDDLSGVRRASANMDVNEKRVARASAGTLAVRPTIRGTWESELVPANPLRSRDGGAQPQLEIFPSAERTIEQTSAHNAAAADDRSRLSSRSAPTKPAKMPGNEEGFAFRNPLRR